MDRHGSDTSNLSTKPIFLAKGGLDSCSCYVQLKCDRPPRQLANAHYKTNEKDGRCYPREGEIDERENILITHALWRCPGVPGLLRSSTRP